MEIITQPPLLPETVSIHWIMLPYETWHYQYADTVIRETEDGAFENIMQQAKLFGRARIMTLTPVHRRVATRERQLLQRYSHYTEADCFRQIAVETGMTERRIKKVLFEVTIIFRLLAATGGLDALLEAT